MKQFISKINNSTRKSLSGIGLDAKKDWNIFLVFICILIIVSFIYHISIFFSSYTEVTLESTADTQIIKTLDREGLSSVINSLEFKRVKYSEFLSNPPKINEPSF